MTLNNAQLTTAENGRQFVTLNLTHTGNCEAFGHFTATYTAGGETINATAPRNIRLYREVDTVTINVPVVAENYNGAPLQLTLKAGSSVEDEVLFSQILNP